MKGVEGYLAKAKPVANAVGVNEHKIFVAMDIASVNWLRLRVS
jgi:hypothetical protein